ncbi:MAG: hypothetical protein V3W37_06875, partial [Candidatus Binatia bacterium]
NKAIASHAWTQALQTILGFECFGITLADSSSEILAAGTSTLRNPCYLLAKLRMPAALDDPQFLPIITVGGTARPELFYHYRQYALSPDSLMSLLFYPAVSEKKRPASFSLINSLVNGVSDAVDPWTPERAQQLCQGIVLPIIQGRKPTESQTFTLELVDVGAGSGSLASRLCRQIQVLGESVGFTPRFRVWSVDLEVADPTRFFRAKRVRVMVDSLMFLGDDYRGWLSRPHPLPKTIDLRIALVSKLLDIMSRFSIRCLSSKERHLVLGNTAAASGLRAHLPAHCLAPGSRGVEALTISNSRVSLHDGRTFAQLSLSEFYRGLYLLSREGIVGPVDEGTFLPIRTFNPNCLVTLDGQSVVARLVENCDYVIIEDADLSPMNLIDHMTTFSLHSIHLQDMTKALRLTGNYAYVLWPKVNRGRVDFPGKQIW